MNNQQKRNYYHEMEQVLEKEKGNAPNLFLHACCAPCSSHCLEVLCQYFQVCVFFYNPNITFAPEYRHRVEEEKRLIACFNEEMREGTRTGYPISILEGAYVPQRFLELSKGLENCPEGGERCEKCFRLRLEESFRVAAQENENRRNRGEALFSYVTTTLTISPLKNAALLNAIGEEIAPAYETEGLSWLPSDFKKKEGYKRSVQLSAEYDLYRQDYCGCGFSKAQREQEKEKQGGESYAGNDTRTENATAEDEC